MCNTTQPDSLRHTLIRREGIYKITKTSQAMKLNINTLTHYKVLKV